MTATPMKGTVTLRYNDGEVDMQALSFSDVANAYATVDASGLTFYQTKKNGVLADISLSAAGVDTTKIRIYVNNKDTGLTILDSGVVSTVNNRVPVPIPIAGNAQIQFKQIA